MELTFQTERVSGRVWRIFGFNTELMYLVEGTERAALLDTGSGFGSLKRCVDGLTDKPVTVLLTHGHTDHALGAAEFDVVSISPLDEEAYAVHSQMAFRRNSGRMWPDFPKLTEDQIVPPLPFDRMRPLYPGDRFDLGGVSVEALACPGHTRGTLVFLIPEERMLLLGDACNHMTFVYDDLSATIGEYRASLTALETELAGRYDRVLLSHGDGEGVPDQIARVRAVCDDILAGRADAQPFTFLDDHAFAAKAVGPDGRRLDGGVGNIVYSLRTAR